ncbi:fungal-specific transcription factor domain-containing protein [Neohortaea acidophila]|uniref:Fungal-specific transcription factor domain-containing protein n=1 Tax=Neohortaea acidophila TaxID=245834 RepID=A0A6A6Q7S4_9PEZI|nr:fungal-specific transcription factor domain-containing protein [Neohortaea acidophila]KAF2487703.1 fungal-specific transcription factor domain-containing protein [Neohortaea acidophila]
MFGEPRQRVLTLAAVPIYVAEFLFRTYVTRIIPQYPIFHETQVEDAFRGVFGQPASGPIVDANLDGRDVFVVSIILAISLSTAARVKHKRAHALATGLFRNAVLRASAALTNDLPGLQALLLLIQYAFLDPAIANLWLLTGLSSEACIDMGLHRELPPSAGLDVLQRDLRRRVFWCAWEMEVAVSAAFHRPLRTQPTCIDVSFPSEFDDHAITEVTIDTTARRTKAVSRRIWLFRQVEASIISVLYQEGPLPEGMTLETWMTNADKEINEWKLEVHRAAEQYQDDAGASSQWKEMELYANIASMWILVQLYRPCPRIKAPDRTNLAKAATAAVQVANGYWEQQTTQFGYLKYVFHPCHHVFSSALVFLQALQHSQANMAALYSLEEIAEQANSFPRFFTTIAERWPAAARCSEEYDRLLGPIQEEFSNFVRRSEASTWASALSDNSDGAMEIRPDLSDSLNTWPMMYTSMHSAGFDSIDPSWSVPYDWDDEFAFGIELESLT